MTLKEYKKLFSKTLSGKYPQTEIDTFFFYLMEAYLDFQRIDLVLRPNFELSTKVIIEFKRALEALTKEIPIQYILVTPLTTSLLRLQDEYLSLSLYGCLLT